MKKLIVLCDGTWCGLEANTQTNIYLLAKMIMAGQDPYLASPYQDNNRGIQAYYFRGAGLGGTFLEDLFNGATGNDIDENCIEVYRYIVQHYTPQHEIWMFGLSRGAYTRRRNGHTVPTNDNPPLTDEEKALCEQVYKIYRSEDPEDHPKGSRSNAFRKRASYDMPTPPVKFMGLFDTVGSLGIPYLNPGIGLDFREFYDTKVSSVVEKVYHALSMHDRLWGFEPCHALPDSHRIGPQFEIHERWFPGCHYDLGRQRFRFLGNGSNWFEYVVGRILGPLSNVIEPNHVFADLVLKWMLEKIRLHDPPGRVIHNINNEIN
ncbi:hypothetical protein BGZ68_001329, partial [Mortierella alpina]